MPYQPQDNYADFYPARVQEFTEEGWHAGLSPAVKDSTRVALVLVDVQYDFVHPNGYLSVPNAQADLERTNMFIYNHADQITSIYASLDTHRPFQIFFPTWWAYDDTGEHPTPFTMIVLDKRGAVDAQSGRTMHALIDPLGSMRYLKTLKTQSNLDLMIWPFHCIEGTQGRSLMPSLSEALAYYSAARLSQVTYIAKGTAEKSEHYGIWAAEVIDPNNPATALNTQILDALGSHDLLYIAGQAKSHCVLATIRQTVAYFKNQPDVLKRIRVLIDCTSSVVHPAVDFDALANAEIAKMTKLGIQLVQSTDPIR